VSGYTLVLVLMLGAFAVAACVLAIALLKGRRSRMKKNEFGALVHGRYAPPKSRKVGELTRLGSARRHQIGSR
jgi:hypothetical protein